MIEKNDFFPIGIGTYKLNLEDKFYILFKI